MAVGTIRHVGESKFIAPEGRNKVSLKSTDLKIFLGKDPVSGSRKLFKTSTLLSKSPASERSRRAPESTTSSGRSNLDVGRPFAIRVLIALICAFVNGLAGTCTVLPLSTCWVEVLY